MNVKDSKLKTHPTQIHTKSEKKLSDLIALEIH